MIIKKIENFSHNFLTSNEQRLSLFIIALFIFGCLLHQLGFAYETKFEGIKQENLIRQLDKEVIQSFDLNQVTYEDLLTIKGIGPKKALAIMDFQKLHGFKNVEDLLEIKGFGPKTYEKLKNNFFVSHDQQKIYADTLTQKEEKSVKTSDRIHISKITLENLQTIKGIGPKRAQAIIDYRNSYGISSYDDFLKIKGIGTKKLELIKEKVYFSEENNNTLYPLSQKENNEITNNKTDINQAKIEDFLKIKGLGKKRALDIIAYREEKGRINNLQELLQIKGIGEKTLNIL